jgi:crotonobetainyl-CoA:carnitine CoA-transferase CaiB-like acyl-CoA transferase
LRERDRSGIGQHIDMALLDVQVSVLANQSLNYLVSGKPPGRLGNAHPNIVPYQAFATSDGYLILAVGNDSQFANFCKSAGRSELAKDARFSTNPLRVKHREILVPMVKEILLGNTTKGWIDSLEQAGVPCGPINNIEQVFDDEQVVARGLQRQLEHATVGSVPTVLNPIRYNNATSTSSTAPPALGQHTEQVLADELDLSGAEISQLRRDGII